MSYLRAVKLCLLLVIGLGGPALYSKTNILELKKVEAYLDGLRTLKATFRQVDGDGRVMRGTFYLSRPGKMRLVYDPPYKQTIMADGNFLIFHNPDLDETTQVPLDSTPAQFILSEHVNFQEEARITDFKQRDGRVFLSMTMASDPDAGAITLVFRADPLQLEQWTITDPDGRLTRVFLEGIQSPVRIEPSLFMLERRF